MTPDWQSTFKTVNDRSLGLFQTMKLSDCSFLVGLEHNRKVFQAHKLMLSMASPVFETMFYGPIAEKEFPIVIPDVHPKAFQALLEYIYTDRINADTFRNATVLYYVAQKYMLPHVVEYCINYVTSHLNLTTACRGYEFAKMFDQPSLMQASMDIIIHNTGEMLADPGFVDIEISTLIEIVGKDYLNIATELELFYALERYAAARGSLTAECEDGVADACLFRPAVEKIRFLLMTPKEFAEGPASSNLLNHHDKFSILMNISSGDVKECPMPEGFSTSTSHRKPKVYYPISRTQSCHPLKNRRKKVVRT